MSAALALLCVVRIGMWKWGAKRTYSTAEAVRRLKGAVAMSGLVAVLFFLWGAALYPYGDPYARSQVAFFMAITIIGCIFCLMHFRPAALALTIVGVVPTVAFLASTGQPIIAAMGLNLALVSVAISTSCSTHSRDFANMINFQKELGKKHLETLRLADENSRLANLDALTDLPNRRRFFANLHEMLRRAEQQEKRFAVGVIDLDGFKPVNDVYGHVTGDQVLVETGRRLREISDETMLLARLGGDEFGFSSTPISPKRKSAPWRAHLRGPPGAFPALGRRRARSPARLVSPLSPRPERRRNRCSSGPTTRSITQSKMLAGDRSSLANTKSRSGNSRQSRNACAMPIWKRSYPSTSSRFSTSRAAIVAFEALARWDSPELGRVPPNIFVRVAERSDFIHPSHAVLLRKALASAADLARAMSGFRSIFRRAT